MPGVVGRKPIHLLEAEQRKKVVELKSMHIDIGAGDREAADALVRVGDPVVIAAEPHQVAGGRLVSRAMDNRLGAYVALECLRRCAEGNRPAAPSPGSPPCRRRSASSAPAPPPSGPPRPRDRRGRHPRHRRPGIDEKEVGSHPLGSGPVIGRGSTLSPKVFELLVETAEGAGIEYSIGASGRGTSTDADAIQISRAGIPTGARLDPAPLHALAGRDGRPCAT